MLEFDFQAKVGAFRLHARGRQAEPRMGLFGPSGCGKTTLLNCLAGLLRPCEGYISLHGRRLFDAAAGIHVPPHRRGLGYVFQEGRLFPHMTVRANIEYGRPRDGRGPGLAQLSEVLDLGGLLDRQPGTLSAGERQRVALARALAAAPRLLLLDEPLASVDEDSRVRILAYLRRIYEGWQVPFIYVSHSLSEILFLAGSCWRMAGGRVVQTAHPRDLLARSSHALSPIVNIVEGTVREVPPRTGYALVRCGDQVLKVPNEELRPGDAVAVALPARDLMLSVGCPRGLSARNVLPASVQRMDQNGHALWVMVRSGGAQLVVELTEDAGRELGLHCGMPVYLVAKSHSLTVTRLRGMHGRPEPAGQGASETPGGRRGDENEALQTPAGDAVQPFSGRSEPVGVEGGAGTGSSQGKGARAIRRETER